LIENIKNLNGIEILIYLLNKNNMPLTDIQRDELENDLIELEELIEKETNMEELKILCQRKVGILTRL
jgi:hypothetical protein